MWAQLVRLGQLVLLDCLEQLANEAVLDCLDKQERLAARVHKVLLVNLDQGVILAHKDSLDLRASRVPLVHQDLRGNPERKEPQAELDLQDSAGFLEHQDLKVILD